MRSLLLLAVLLAGCGGPPPAVPAAPVPDELDQRYVRAFEYLRAHPEVRAFAARHTDAAEAIGIEVAAEVVPVAYAPVLARVLKDRHGLAEIEHGDAALVGAVRDSLARLESADRFDPFELNALPLLSRRQRHPVILFFARPSENRLAAQLFPNPYRRRAFEHFRDARPMLTLLMELGPDGSIQHCHIAESAE
jgi:hypothetical protein